MWKAHGIWIALWWLWNDSSHRSCVWRMKIINYKSPSYLIPLERELEASVVPFALLCFSLSDISCFPFGRPHFSSPTPASSHLFLRFILLSPLSSYSFQLFSFPLQTALLSPHSFSELLFYLHSPFACHVVQREQNREFESRGFGLSRGSGSVLLTLLLRPSLRPHAEMELSLKASCSTHQSFVSKSPRQTSNSLPTGSAIICMKASLISSLPYTVCNWRTTTEKWYASICRGAELVQNVSVYTHYVSMSFFTMSIKLFCSKALLRIIFWNIHCWRTFHVIAMCII